MGGTVDDAAEGVDAADTFTLTRALALVIQARLANWAIRVRSTSSLAESGDASLAVGTLAVTHARELTHTGSAAFTFGAIQRVTADGFALAAHARAARRAIGIGTTALRLSDTSLIWRRVRVETERTRARRPVVDDATGGVRSAESVARVDAASVQAGTFCRTVVVAVRASSIGSASSSVRVSDSVERTRAHHSSGRH